MKKMIRVAAVCIAGGMVLSAFGADAYIVKPFEAKEVVARIKAVLRRVSTPAADQPKEVNYEKRFRCSSGGLSYAGPDGSCL